MTLALVKFVVLVLLGIFVLYLVVRVASLAVLKSWQQVILHKLQRSKHHVNTK